MYTAAICHFRPPLKLCGATTIKSLLPNSRSHLRDCVRYFICLPGNVPTVTFNNGEVYPQLGYGTWMAPPAQVYQGVKTAIDIGYRHIDCAFVYQNEKEVGKAIADKIAQGVVKRDDLYITSKLWNTHHREEIVIPTLKGTLKDLGLDYLDLYLIHWPVAYKEGHELIPEKDGEQLFSEIDYTETWRAMEEAVSQGLVKSIGLANFNSGQVSRILTMAKIKPVTLQVECHPYLTQRRLKYFCDACGITMTAYSPLGSGDRPWAKSTDPKLLKDKTLKEIASHYDKSPAQILLRYQIQRGNLVLVKSIDKLRIKENFQIFDFEICPPDMAVLDSMNRNFRYVHKPGEKHHIYYPFNATF